MHWDIFCKVIDNHGDLGVCWRLCTDLVARGEAVRLWVDDATALAWMAPAASRAGAGVEVRPWSNPLDMRGVIPGDVMLESFGCDIAPEFIAACPGIDWAKGQKYTQPLWINLEYLSAEPYVERSHRMPSPIGQGPGAGRTRWFFYPGFTVGTGGVPHETALPARHAALDAAAWRAAHAVPDDTDLRIALFCYEPAPLAELLEQVQGAEHQHQHGRDHQPTGRPSIRLLATAGRASKAVRALQRSTRHITHLPYLPQTAFDELLWACDLNFVRGEDSLVRAIWAGQPFVWQIYPQDDGAHRAKLDAFLDWLQAPQSLRQYHQIWNGLDGSPLPPLTHALLAEWRCAAQAARARLAQLPDLTSQLIRFAAEKR